MYFKFYIFQRLRYRSRRRIWKIPKAKKRGCETTCKPLILTNGGGVHFDMP